MADIHSADLVIVGTGVVGCTIAEQALDAGLSVVMLEAGPRVERWQIVENFRNLPPSLKANWNAPYPPKPWAPHLETYTEASAAEYLQLEGPDALAYRQGYVRYAGGATWHWAGICWRLTPEDMKLKSLYGVGRDWVFDYDTLEPYYTRARIHAGRKRALRSRPSMARFARNPILWIDCLSDPGNSASQTPRRGSACEIFQPLKPVTAASHMTTGRHAAAITTASPVCPIGAKYDAATTLPRIEAKGGVILANAVVYRIETGSKNAVQAVHFFDPDKISHRVTGKVFVIACNGIETPKNTPPVKRRKKSQRRREWVRSGRT